MKSQKQQLAELRARRIEPIAPIQRSVALSLPALESLETGAPITRPSVSVREPSARELLAEKLQAQLGKILPEKTAKSAARKVTGYGYPVGLIDVTPAGIPLWAYEGGQSLAKAAEAAGEGEYGTAAFEGALGALSLAPAAQPAAAGAKAVGKQAAKAIDRAMMTGEGPLGSALAGIRPQFVTAYHGTPHQFEKFDLSKIGTGEGAQAYGHGLYFAESPEVAKGYADQVKNMVAIDDINKELSRLSKIMSADEIGYRNYRTAAGKQAAAQYDALLAQKEAIRTAPGSLYKVDIPDEAVARMLDWDKPLKEQHPDVQKALQKTKNKQLRSIIDYASSPYTTPGLEDEIKTMGEAIKLLGMNTSPAKASALLSKHGIPGIKYLDQGSRGTGEGTRNFVLFSEDLPRILEVNENPTGAKPWAPGEWGRPAFEYPQAEALETARKNAVEMLGLPENNTPMDRARAMGFDPVYHGTKTPEQIKNLIPGGTNESTRTGDAYGLGIYSTTNPFEASSYAGEGGVLPLMLRRESHLPVDNPDLEDLARLSALAGEQMLPSDKARFAIGRKTKQFENVEDAREFFANQRENWQQFGGGYDRARPDAIANPDGTFAVEFTDFDAAVPITSGEEANTLLKAVGWDTVPSMGYAGHTLNRSGGSKWDVTTDPSKLRSRFAAFDPARMNENDLLGYANLGILPYVGGLGALGLSQIEEKPKKKGTKNGK